MFYRNHNLRRTIGLLGVALALLSGIQQGHAFCYLAGCDSASTRAEQSDQMADSLVAACSCSRACNKTRTKSSASIACEGVANQSEPCPCPPACWCHQLPEPLGLPASASVSVDLLSQSDYEDDILSSAEFVTKSVLLTTAFAPHKLEESLISLTMVLALLSFWFGYRAGMRVF